MNKKTLYRLMTGIITITLLTACGQAQNPNENNDPESNTPSEEGLLDEDGVRKDIDREQEGIPEDNSVIEDKE